MARFDTEKNNVMEQFNQSLDKQLIDSRVIPVLNIINSHEDYYSTSSCSGRVFLLALPSPGAKKESIILTKWHEVFSQVQLDDGIIKWKKHRYLFLLAQAAIFHVIVRNLSSALHLRNLGEEAGFKYSSLRSIKPLKKSKEVNSVNDNSTFEETVFYSDAKITVELLSTERLNIPIGIDQKIMVDDEYLKFIVKISNDAMRKTHKKLIKLENILRINLG
jgi:tRNA wybutosine-synthesizing protein 3